MVFKKIEEDVWKPENSGDEVTGRLFKTEEDIGEFNSNLYHLETEAGKQLAVWGSVLLDHDMAFVNIGDKIKIVYKGTKATDKKGRQPTKIYEVFKDIPDKTSE